MHTIIYVYEHKLIHKTENYYKEEITVIKASTKTTNGLTLMLYLALDYKKKPVSLKEVSKKEDISARYLEQIIILLKNAGLVGSNRGAKGGYYLTRPPDQVKMSEIIRALEGSWALVECVENEGYCSKVDSCTNYDIWKEATKALSDVFEKYTLSDMVQKNENILQKENKEIQANERWRKEFFEKEDV